MTEKDIFNAAEEAMKRIQDAAIEVEKKLSDSTKDPKKPCHELFSFPSTIESGEDFFDFINACRKKAGWPHRDGDLESWNKEIQHILDEIKKSADFAFKNKDLGYLKKLRTLLSEEFEEVEDPQGYDTESVPNFVLRDLIEKDLKEYGSVSPSKISSYSKYFDVSEDFIKSEIAATTRIYNMTRDDVMKTFTSDPKDDFKAFYYLLKYQLREIKKDLEKANNKKELKKEDHVFKNELLISKVNNLKSLISDIESEATFRKIFL